MKILIIGGSGVIGWNLLEFLKKKYLDVEFTFKTNKSNHKDGYCLDITNQKETIDIISKVNPDLIIHTAGLVNVDLCQRDKNLADQINVKGTSNVIEASQKIKSRIIYISTSFVFEGNNEKYSEDHIPTNPRTYYGLTKLNGERLILNSGLKFLILRIDQPYGWNQFWHHTNSVLRVIDTLSKGEKLREVTDWFNVPTYVPDFVEATYALITNQNDGIFHLTGPDFINRFELALKTAEIFGLEKKLLIPISSEQLNLDATRDKINLDNRKIYEKTGIRMRGIEDGLKDMLVNRPYIS